MIAVRLILLWLCVVAGAAQAQQLSHHRISVRLQPADGTLQVSDVVTVRERSYLEFTLAPWLEVSAVALGEVPLATTRTGHRWRIELPDAGQHRVRIELGGRLPPGESNRAATYFGADGVYLSPASGWLPVSGDRRVNYDLSIEVDAPWRAVASGRLESESQGGGSFRARFLASYPAEPPALFAGPWNVRERQLDGRRLRTYFHAELDSLAPAYLDAAARHLREYSTRIGEYPYDGFSVVSAPLPVGLGFAGLTYVGRRVLPLPFMREQSLAHEILHSWWGSGVAVDYAGGNWAEGLTTYLADYALAARRGEDEALEMRRRWLRDYTALPARRDQPVVQFTTKDHDAAQVIGYHKAAFVFHMLEREIGPQPFAAGLRRFWAQRRFTRAGWSHLQAAFEAAAGRDLGWFFSQWLTRGGAPVLSLGEVSAMPAGDGYRLTLVLEQQPPAYRLRLGLAIETAGGTRDAEFIADSGTTRYFVTTNERPLAVRIDPRHHTFRRLAREETPTIARDVTLGSRTRIAVAAAAPEYVSAARRLGERLLDAPASGPPATPDELRRLSGPLLLIGPPGELAPLLPTLGLDAARVELQPARPAAFALRRANGDPILLISAADVSALQTLLRRLPHYGGRSYVVFDGTGEPRSGVWEAGNSPLARRLE